MLSKCHFVSPGSCQLPLLSSIALNLHISPVYPPLCNFYIDTPMALCLQRLLSFKLSPLQSLHHSIDNQVSIYLKNMNCSGGTRVKTCYVCPQPHVACDVFI